MCIVLKEPPLLLLNWSADVTIGAGIEAASLGEPAVRVTIAFTRLQ